MAAQVLPVSRGHFCGTTSARLAEVGIGQRRAPRVDPPIGVPLRDHSRPAVVRADRSDPVQDGVVPEQLARGRRAEGHHVALGDLRIRDRDGDQRLGPAHSTVTG
jgi:hypothetical protein